MLKVKQLDSCLRMGVVRFESWSIQRGGARRARRGPDTLTTPKVTKPKLPRGSSVAPTSGSGVERTTAQQLECSTV